MEEKPSPTQRRQNNPERDKGDMENENEAHPEQVTSPSQNIRTDKTIFTTAI